MARGQETSLKCDLKVKPQLNTSEYLIYYRW